MATTRRRGAELEKAILEAGWDQLLSDGYSGFTFEAIAERAQTGKAVLYRRWSGKEALLLAVITQHHLDDSQDLPDTGSLRDDVLELLRSRNAIGDHIAALLSAILGAHFDDTHVTIAELRRQLLEEHGPTLRSIVQRAVARGEIPGPAVPERVASLPFELFRAELIMRFDRVPDETLVDIVDTAFIPLASLPWPH